MTEPVRTAADRIDLGGRLFVASFYVPLSIGSLMAILGLGHTGSVWIVLLGIANIVVLSYLGNRMYSGKGPSESVVWLLGGATFLIAVGIMAVGVVGFNDPTVRKNTSQYAVQFLVPTLFALGLTLGPVRAFLRSRRGEKIQDVPAKEGSASFLDAEGALREEVRQPLGQYALISRLVSGLLMVGAITAILLAIFTEMSWGGSVRLILVGILAIPPAVVLFTFADHWTFLTSTRGYEKVHLANAIRDARVIVICVAVAVALMGMLTVFELALR